MVLASKEFKVKDIKLDLIYSDFAESYQNSNLNIAKVEQIYGELRLPPFLAERPLLYGCFVSSIDGTIAFKDNPKSSQIARENQQDSTGGEADLWVLNLLRAIADGIIIGPKTLQAEENLTGHIFDKKLLKARTKLLNKPEVPYNIIISKTGQSIPYQHRIFKEEKVPVIIVTSPKGSQTVVENISSDYKLVKLSRNNNLNKESILNADGDEVIVLVSGEDYSLEDELVFKFLKQSGLDKIIVETPSYAHYLMQHKLLDELFLNQSGIYIGGPKFLNNKFETSFKVEQAPTAKIVSIHSHSSYFFYYRYKLNY